MEMNPEIIKANAKRLLDEFSTSDIPVCPTELFLDNELSNRYDAEVWLASELHQPGGAYKVRGAFSALSNLSPEELDNGLVTASAGNHAVGLAIAANYFNASLTIFLPENTPKQKVNNILNYSNEKCELVFFGDSFDETSMLAKKYQINNNKVFIHPFDDLYVISGQATLGVEIESKLEPDYILCPIGGGGLISGIGSVFNKATTKVIGVEPEGAASMAYAMNLEYPAEIPSKLDTFVDGAAVKQVGWLTLSLALSTAESVLNVSNIELCSELIWLRERPNPINVELAGALSVTGLSKMTKELRGKKVVAILSGGNISNERYYNDVLNYNVVK